MEIRKISENVDIIIPNGFEMYSGDLKTTPTIDYGVVKKGSEKERRILFIFDKKDDLITSTSGSCTCTSAKVIKTEGLTQEVEVVFNKTNSVGDTSKLISLYSNGKKQLMYVNVRVEG